MIIGLIGGIGSGKSTAAKLFRELNVTVMDADQIARELVEKNSPSYESISRHFGQNILQKDGSLNRAKLRSIIFEDPKERLWLESLLHPLIKEELKLKASKIPKGSYAVLEIPLLIESNFQNSVDRILLIDSLEEQQINRIMQRDGSSKETILSIMKTQVPRTTRLAMAHDVIMNDSTLNELKKKIKNIHLYYTELAKSEKMLDVSSDKSDLL